MAKTISLPFDTQFIYDENNQTLQLESLLGMVSANFGLCVVSCNKQRYDSVNGNLKYEVVNYTNDSISYVITDKNQTIKFETQLYFFTKYNFFSFLFF